MIKFFRKIRQNSLSEGKTGKPVGRTGRYLKYAAGEIVLVVIGILIALQINNWNDERKDRLFEHEILTLINESLKNDSIALAKQVAYSKEASELTNRLFEHVSNQDYNDSIYRWMGKIISFETFRSQSSAFEILKSKGIDVISNKELQLELISYYDKSLYGVYEALEDVEESFKDDWTPIIKEDFSDYKWRDYAIPADPISFFEKRSNISLIKLYNENRSSGRIHYLEVTLEKISRIRELSNEHLDE